MPTTGGGQSGAIKAGSAFVELFANDSKLMKGLEFAKKKLNQFAKYTATIGAGVAGAGPAGSKARESSANPLSDVPKLRYS